MRNNVLQMAAVVAGFGGTAAACYVCGIMDDNLVGSCGSGTFSVCTNPTRQANTGETGNEQLGPGTMTYGCTSYTVTASQVINGPCSGNHPGYTLVFQPTGSGNCCWVSDSVSGTFAAIGTTDQCWGQGCVGQ